MVSPAPEAKPLTEDELADTWRLANDDEIPARFTDPKLDNFMTVCSNGFTGDLTLGSAFAHKPHQWPQCFPAGVEGDASCTSVVLRRAALSSEGK